MPPLQSAAGAAAPPRPPPLPAATARGSATRNPRARWEPMQRSQIFRTPTYVHPTSPTTTKLNVAW